MIDVSVDRILEENNLSKQDVDNCIKQIARVDQKIKVLYESVNNNWEKLSEHVVRRILELYNNSKVNVITGELVDVFKEEVTEFDPKKLFNVCLTVDYLPFEDVRLDMGLFVVTKTLYGNINIFNTEENNSGFTFYGYKDKTTCDFKEIVEVDLLESDEDLYKIIFFMYINDIRRVDNMFVNVLFTLEDFYGKELVEINSTDAANSSCCVLGFEFINESGIWKAQVLNEDINLSLEELIKLL